jgi:hypothetical protein
MWVSTNKATTLKKDTTPKVVTHWKNTVTILTMISFLTFPNKKGKKKQSFLQVGQWVAGRA